MSDAATYFQGPFSFGLDLRVVGSRVEMTWTEWAYGGPERVCSRVVETGLESHAAVPAQAGVAGPWPPLTVPGHAVCRPVVAVDPRGVAYLTCCLERLVELDGGDANWHSRIVTATLREGSWELNGESCIDYAMNPWMAGYAGRRRTPSLTVDPAGGAWVFFEEKLDPTSMSPGPGRLIMRRIGETTEHILLSGHSEYHVAEHLLPDGRLVVASLTQHDRYQARPPAYELHCINLKAPLEPRPAGLPDNAAAPLLRVLVTGPEPRPRDGDRQLYFGDPHLHSALSGDLEGDQEELYLFARDVAKLDFVAFTENDYVGFTHPLTPAAWERSKRNAAFFNVPGVFTAFVGWEYTLHAGPGSPGTRNSHRSVLFPGADGPVCPWFKGETPIPEALVRALRGRPVLLHHHHPNGYDITDDRVECNIEVCSGWCNCMRLPGFVTALHGMLDRGLHLGFIGGSDNHERNPGLGGALTGVWAEANTREAIFAAFQARRVFATTGPRPDLRFKVAGAFMGETVTADAAPSVELTVSCSTPIAAAEIARDGQTVFTQSCDSTAVAIAWKDAACRPGEHYYYAHIVFAGTAATLPWNRAPAVGVDAWSSPAWVRCC